MLKEALSIASICRAMISYYHATMNEKGQRTIELLNSAVRVVKSENGRLLQKFRIINYIERIQTYMHRIGQNRDKPVNFLRFIKDESVPQDTLYDVIKLLSNITYKGKRARNEKIFTLLPYPVLQKEHMLTSSNYHHISCVTQDQIWVSNERGLQFVNIKTGYVYYVEHSLCENTGIHTVNNRSELIYIDKDYNIKKVSDVLGVKKEDRFVNRNNTTWKPLCLYCSPITGDLLVGMYRDDQETGMVKRYSNTGELKQTILHDDTLYRFPCYITENLNRDVVVSDWGRRAVVVTECGGRHRFSYTGRELELLPRGICTDALSNILVCDRKKEAVQIIDKDGQFLAILEIAYGILRPRSLSYDFKTHRIWTGPGFWTTNDIYVYRHINRHLPKPRHTENKCLHKSVKLQTTVAVKGVNTCGYMSIVSPNRIWVSEGKKLILTDTATGDILYHVTDTCTPNAHAFGLVGFHTISNDNELIYISENYNINKLTSDRQTITTFITRTEPNRRSHCVYCSTCTGDILVGMSEHSSEQLWKGRIDRYNNMGDYLKTIQHDNRGQILYRCPCIITENRNGDVVVCDTFSRAVVVTDRGGRHRFSYARSSSEVGLIPRGICTDEFSHIFICDLETATVHMLDPDGQFLRYILTRYSPGINTEPLSLCFDVNTHRLLLGTSESNTLAVYRISKSTTF